ncbi:MAG: bifunctional methionine sulfoxide reductase B/A protein [Candidatus Aminicenantes bacterium]|nr:bifunctional methionine sulfoxide reductase B/A protein [Candidatus Aminicenantes bacterium]
MKSRIILLLALTAIFFGIAFLNANFLFEERTNGEQKVKTQIKKTDKEWKEILTPEQYNVLRKSGTERPFTGKYNMLFEEGIYSCAACGAPLFESEEKFDHGCGWPSFSAAIDNNSVEFHTDNSMLMNRTEVRCATCGSHLGHVFDDGPAPTGDRFCINSAALDFKSAETENPSQEAIATFAAGCFWGIEHNFQQIEGVLSTRVGYTGGDVKNPTYQLVCSGKTGHAESIEITFDPSVVSYKELLEHFFSLHDPTQIDRQGPDIGTQYRSIIFYHSPSQKEEAEVSIKDMEISKRFRRPVATKIAPADVFYQAEDYHQDYYKKIKIRH